MAVLIHVIIALSSLIYASYLFVRPSAKGFYVGAALTGSTIASGTFLVWQSRGRILPACLAGLMYLGIIAIMMVSAYYRLVKVKNPRQNSDEK